MKEREQRQTKVELKQVARKEWKNPELKRREQMPRVTNGFVGSFTP